MTLSNSTLQALSAEGSALLQIASRDEVDALFAELNASGRYPGLIRLSVDGMWVTDLAPNHSHNNIDLVVVDDTVPGQLTEERQATFRAFLALKEFSFLICALDLAPWHDLQAAALAANA